ncbi:Conserved_hypothetical protein [Hexamita inflata]|uniref:Uncharacterized protein n=1 Tax=Hexamita inflata TaxID=28002 RepID=A0AA86TNY4_9EUKA|nr:Conserved hypothetical protein [Hexamita inflata]
MFVHKFRPDLDLFGLIFNNQFVIRNTTKLYAQYDLNIKFECREHLMQHLNAVLYQGQLYLKYGSAILVLNDVQMQLHEFNGKNTNLVSVTKSETQTLNIEGENDIFALFSLNDKMYLRENKQLNVLENNSFNFVKNLDGFCFQFCNHVYVFDAFNGKENINLYKLKDNLETQLIFHFDALDSISLGNSGVIIFLNQTTIFFVEMISSRVVEQPYKEEFNFMKIGEQLILGEIGLQLKKEILIEIFGEEFPNQLKQCYNSYIQDQINNYPIYSQNCNSLLTFSVLYQYFSDLDLERKNKISQNLTTLTNKIRKQEETMSNILEMASQLLNQAVSQLELLSSVEVCQ